MTIAIILIVFVALYFVAILITDPVSKKEKENIAPIIEMAYAKAGIDRPNWQTLIIAATRDIDLPPEKIWDVWKNLEEWPTWSNTLHESANWKGEAGWKAGAEFDQLLHLGFPIGTQVSEEKVIEVVHGQRVIWAKDKDGIKACHIWSFEILPNGQTRVTNCEVFHGLPIALISPMAAKNWYKKFNTGMDNLIEKAR